MPLFAYYAEKYDAFIDIVIIRNNERGNGCLFGYPLQWEG